VAHCANGYGNSRTLLADRGRALQPQSGELDNAAQPPIWYGPSTASLRATVSSRSIATLNNTHFQTEIFDLKDRIQVRTRRWKHHRMQALLLTFPKIDLVAFAFDSSF
jgi:hypothetical protein